MVEAKESFLTLDKNVRGCQEETRNDCITDKYSKTLLNKCQCLPFQSGFREEVNKPKRPFRDVINVKTLRDIENNYWGILRDIERHWQTLRDMERHWETLKDIERHGETWENERYWKILETYYYGVNLQSP